MKQKLLPFAFIKKTNDTPKDNNVKKEFQEKTVNIPAYEKSALRDIKPASKASNESLFCFF